LTSDLYIFQSRVEFSAEIEALHNIAAVHEKAHIEQDRTGKRFYFILHNCWRIIMGLYATEPRILPVICQLLNTMIYVSKS
jgi:hypothetical protein